MATKPATDATALESGRRVFANLKYIHFTPWKIAGQGENATEELGEVTYNLVNIVGDTTSLEQAENEVNALEHEFKQTPLYENVTLGEKTFAVECIDFRDEVLSELFGWTIEGDNAFAPNGYKDLYCLIEMGFNSTEDVIVLPKVKLNSRAVIASMKTDASRGNITGTCYTAFVKVNEKEHETDMAIIAAASVDAYEVSAKATVTDTTGA